MGLQREKDQAEEEAMQMETGQREKDKVETKAMQIKTSQKEKDEAEAEVTKMVIEAEAKVIKILSGIMRVI